LAKSDPNNAETLNANNGEMLSANATGWLAKNNPNNAETLNASNEEALSANATRSELGQRSAIALLASRSELKIASNEPSRLATEAIGRRESAPVVETALRNGAKRCVWRASG
jgi:hypothetical protein